MEIFKDLLLSIIQRNIHHNLLSNMIFFNSKDINTMDFDKYQVISKYKISDTFQKIFNLLKRIKSNKEILNLLNGVDLDIYEELRRIMEVSKINSSKKQDEDNIYHLIRFIILREFLFANEFNFKPYIQKVKESQVKEFDNVQSLGYLFRTTDNIQETIITLILFSNYFHFGGWNRLKMIKQEIYI